MTVNAFVWRAGVQYVHEFKSDNDEGKKEFNGKRFIVGAYGNSQQNFKTTNASFIKRDNVFNTLSTTDTIAYETGIEGTGVLPTELTFGISYEQANKLRLGSITA